MILDERILALVDARLARDGSCEWALVRFHDVRLGDHINLLLLLSRIIKIIASKNVIVINSMVQLLLLKALLVFLVSVMVDVIYLLRVLIK